MPSVATYSLTGDPYIDGLLGDGKWGVSSFTYSFPSSGSYYESGYGYGEPGNNFQSLNGTQEGAVQTSLSMYASVVNLTFVEIAESATQHADLRFAMSDEPSTAWAYYPSTAPEGGDAWFNNKSGWYDSPVKGNYANSTFLHEIGHSLGLEHPQTGNVMPLDRDSLEYSVMSYRSYIGASLTGGYTNETWGYPQSLMMYDIAALQHLYGANYATNSGNTTYSWNPTTGEMFIDGVGQGQPGANRIFLTIWDGGGGDTYDFSNYTTDLNVNLAPGAWTTTSSAQLAKLHYNGSEVAAGNIANALLFNDDPQSLIENAKGGSGNDLIEGNSAANTLWGLGGNDEIRGGAGNDALFGQAGHDRLFGDDGNDRLIGGNGSDDLYGGNGNDRLLGGPGKDNLFGGAGKDILIGGPGSDVLNGGDDADTFVFRSAPQSSPNATDTIEDFESGLDKIDLRSIDANLSMAGNQAFSFIAGALFSSSPGELNFINNMLSGDTDGDGIADLVIHLAGAATLWESDILL